MWVNCLIGLVSLTDNLYSSAVLVTPPSILIPCTQTRCSYPLPKIDNLYFGAVLVPAPPTVISCNLSRCWYPPRPQIPYTPASRNLPADTLFTELIFCPFRSTQRKQQWPPGGVWVCMAWRKSRCYPLGVHSAASWPVQLLAGPKPANCICISSRPGLVPSAVADRNSARNGLRYAPPR